jgi:hypothetical protein
MPVSSSATSRLGLFATVLVAGTLGCASAARAQAPEKPAAPAPMFFFQTSIDPVFARERGGSSVPAHGAALTLRPVAGAVVSLPGETRLTMLGGASATRYAATPTSDADSIFGMATLSKTVAEHKFGITVMAAESRDPTFEAGLARTYDTTLSVARTFTLPVDGWKFTPTLKAGRRLSDVDIVERWVLGAALEASRPFLGGTFVIGSGYEWLDYETRGRHDDKYSVSTSWMIDLNDMVQIGARAEASSLKSNLAGKSVDSLEIGPTMRIMATR